MEGTKTTGLSAPAARRIGDGTGGGLERKLQRMGSVTVGVSLPREWIGQRGLGVGSTIRIRPRSDGALVLLDRVPAPSVREAVLDVGSTAHVEHLFRALIGAYLTGASEFVLRVPGGVTPEIQATVRSFIRRTIQPEIVTEDRTEIRLRDVSLGTFLPVPALLRRMYQTVRTLHSEAGRSWRPEDDRRQPGLEPRDDEVDRHAWLIERVLSMHGWASPSDGEPTGPIEDPVGTLLVARNLERIGDHGLRIEEHGWRLREAGIPPAIADALTDYHGQALAHLRDAFEASQEGDVGRANEVLDTGQALHATHDALSENLLHPNGSVRVPAASLAALGLLLESIDRTTAYAQDIGEVGLDRGAVRRVVPRPRTTSAPAPSRSPAAPAPA